MEKMMIMEGLEKLVKKNSKCIENAELKQNTKLIDDLNYDSFSMIQLIVDIEDQFNIEFNDSDLDVDNFPTMGELAACVEKLINEKSN